MTAISWSQAARTDLRAIHSYRARDSKRYADHFLERIKFSVESLRNFPESGSIVPEWQCSDIREIFVGNYRIIYRIETDSIEIIAVVHGARHIEGLFNPDDP